MEWLLPVCLGIGLSAACGFRIFVPMLGMSIAAQAGHLTLSSGFEWIGSVPALVCFSVATVLEIGAFYIPWLDNLLDSIATPAAVVAGTILTASVLTFEMSPLMHWSVAIIAGGGSAGLVQTGTVLVRGTSTATTGGAANFMVSTGEWIGALLTTLLAFVAPILAAIAVIGLVTYILYRLLVRRSPAEIPAEKFPPKQLLL